MECADSDPFGIVGTIVDGRYLVERVVGSGGFAVVYQATHLRFDSPVAIKVLHRPPRSGPGRQGEFARQLLTEGKFLFDLAPLHPSFVRVFETGSLTTGERRLVPYLALEWLQGSTLKEELARLRRAGRRFDLGQAMSLFQDVVHGLSIAHRQRIAHRDIKPANIFLCSRDGKVTPRILDFGLAKAMSHGELESDAFGDSSFAPTPFTPAYGAPEQWQRRLGATGSWTDVHALALLFVEVLSGRQPLLGSDSAMLMAACLDPAARPSPRALGVDLSDAVDTVFMRALAIDPRERYRDATTFWSALEHAAGIAGLGALPQLDAPLLGVAADLSQATVDADEQLTASSRTAALEPLGSQTRGRRGAWRAVRETSGPGIPVLIALVLASGGFSLSMCLSEPKLESQVPNPPVTKSAPDVASPAAVQSLAPRAISAPEHVAAPGVRSGVSPSLPVARGRGAAQRNPASVRTTTQAAPSNDSSSSQSPPSPLGEATFVSEELRAAARKAELTRLMSEESLSRRK